MIQSMRSIVLVALACLALASSCVSYESLAKSCLEHYVDCQDSGLGYVRDGPNRSRCQTCLSICNDTGSWPQKTYSGGTCEYWMYRGGPLSHEDMVDAQP
jgi:hypothetical protein